MLISKREISAVLQSFEKFVTSRDLAVSLLACINSIRA